MAVLCEFGYLPWGFTGFARQPGCRTVEGEIIKVLVRTGAVDDIGKAGFRSSSRTDKGVGAFQNYFTVITTVPGEELLRRLNSMIEGAYFYGVGVVEENFNPRHAVFREYVYYLDGNLIGTDIARFKEAIELFTGTHSFYSFTKKDRTKDEEYFRAEHTIEKITVKEVVQWGRHIVNGAKLNESKIHLSLPTSVQSGLDRRSRLQLDNVRGIAVPKRPIPLNLIEVTLKAEYFLYGQIRKMLKAALMAAKHKIEMTEIENALVSGSGIRRFPSHSPGGLFLKRVRLPDEVEAGIKRYDIPGEGMEKMIAEAAVELRALSVFRELINP